MPLKHSLRSILGDSEANAKQCKDVATALQVPPLTDMKRYEMLLGASLNTLEATWEAYQSNFEANWQTTGAGI